jgi:hypothetical protein
MEKYKGDRYQEQQQYGNGEREQRARKCCHHVDHNQNPEDGHQQFLLSHILPSRSRMRFF